MYTRSRATAGRTTLRTANYVVQHSAKQGHSFLQDTLIVCGACAAIGSCCRQASLDLEYVPSPKVYEVCFWKRTINSMIIIRGFQKARRGSRKWVYSKTNTVNEEDSKRDRARKDNQELNSHMY